MSELQGQLEMKMNGEIKETDRPVEGYDENGNLMDYAPPAGDGDEAARLAVEINAIKEQARGTVIAAALAIGRRLVAARALVPYGRWASWLAENVDYSERKALDLMNLFEEYGKKTIPQAIAELDYTKAVALLSLPEDQRQEVAEQAAGMSTRELQAEVKRLRRAAADRQVRMDELEKENDALAAAAEDARSRQREDWETAKATIQSEREAAERARAEAKAAGETAEALKKERDEAKKTGKLETDRAREAVKRAKDTQAQLTEARARIAELESAEPEVREVEHIPEAMAAELERLRAAGSRSEAVLKLRLGYERLMAEFRAVEALLAAVAAEDAAEGERYANALAKACDLMKGRLGMPAEAGVAE